jgi:FkbM family methyltransferase
VLVRSPESYKLLEENIALNGTGNVIAAPIAVGARSGQMTLFATGAAVQHTTTKASGTAEAISVQGLGLDDVFAMNALTTCDFLKMDCEGGEYDILFNASAATLEKISNISLEYHNGVTRFSHTDLLGYLQQRGFQVKSVPNPVHSHLGFLYAHR